MYEMDVEREAIVNTFAFNCDAVPRGGVNAVAVSDRWVVGTHSEHGVIAWPRKLELSTSKKRDSKVEPHRLFENETTNAKAVRCALFASGRFWCSIDDTVYCVLDGDLKSGHKQLRAGTDMITALAINGDDIFAGTVDGDVLHWMGLNCESPRTLHAGSRRPVESIASVLGGDITRLFYTDTSLAVYSRVLGDSFVCRYEAGGQTLRRADCASDIVVSINDARDRMIVWNGNEPRHPAQSISIVQLTGHSAQDVCLLPLNSSASIANVTA